MSDPDLTIGSESESKQPAPRRKHSLGKRIGFGCLWIVLIFIILVGLMMAHIVGRFTLNGNRDRWEQQARQIGQMMFAYSVDHGDKYPSGNSSTEVFQKLIDTGYATDSAIFYVPLVGKSKPVIGQKLKPENVSFDVTANVTSDDSDALPLLFMTGYKVAYIPGGTATPLSSYGFQSPWPKWFMEFYNPESQPLHEIAVCYKGNSAEYMIYDGRFIPSFISPKFDARGKTYRQLTPDGPLQ